MLGIYSLYTGKTYPTTGGMLLFGINRAELLPDAMVRCARFGGLQQPHIEEVGNQFRLTLFSGRAGHAQRFSWEELLIEKLKAGSVMTSKDAAILWNVTTRTARQRLKTMVDKKIIQRIATSEKDPRATFVLEQK